MKLCFVFLVWLLPLYSSFTGQPSVPDCSCPVVTNVQKTGGTSSSFSFSWDAPAGANQYKVWYHRREGGFTSGDFYTASTSYSFQNLSTGAYTFYVAAICGTEMSGWIGIEDLVEN